MQSRTILAPVTIIGALVTLSAVVSQKLSESGATNQVQSASSLTGNFSAPLNPGESLLTASSLLLTGVSSNVPHAADIPVMREIPWTLQELGREFRRAGNQMSCSMLEPGIQVIQPIAEPMEGTERALGRQVVFAMSLGIDPAASSTLPRVTRGAIESYLESHQMTIQSVFYQDEKGQMFFGPQVRAGFVAVASPERTTEPEAMITVSIKELRTLGVYWDQETEFEPAMARTLVLAFRYTLQTSVLGTGKSAATQEYELLFLHLEKDSTPGHPNVSVFATSNGRTELNLLDAVDPTSAQQTAVIAARIRFGEFNMMGMYPANPIVTGVYHQAKLSLPVDSFKALLEGFASGAPRSLSDVLDELCGRNVNHILGSTDNAASAPDAASPADAALIPPAETDL